MVRTMWLALAVVLGGTPNMLAETRRETAVDKRFFVGVGAIADKDHTWAEAASGGGLSAQAGVDLSRHIGARLVVDVPTMVTVSCGTRCIERHRSLSWSAAIDVHRRLSKRIRFGIITGITAARHFSAFAPSLDQFGSGDTFIWWGFTVGGEFPISLTPRLSVVPEARVVAFPIAEYGRTRIFRPGVSLRWQF
jgi:hypothetical protein